MNINKALDELNERKDNMLEISEVADYLNEPECEIAYKIDQDEIEIFNYNGDCYIPKSEVCRILEGRLNDE